MLFELEQGSENCGLRATFKFLFQLIYYINLLKNKKQKFGVMFKVKSIANFFFVQKTYFKEKFFKHIKNVPF